jgi:hypothetical protein
MNMQELQGGIAQIGQAQAGDLSSMQPQQVQQMANTVNPMSSLPQLFALAAVQKKQQDARRAQAEAAKRRMQQAPRTVAEKVQTGYPFETQEQQSPVPPPQQSPMAPPAMQQPGMQGIPQLPTGQAVPQQYASGGIVAFQHGGQANLPGGVDPNLPGVVDPVQSMYGASMDDMVNGTSPFDINRSMLRRQRDAYIKAGRIADAQRLDSELATVSGGPKLPSPGVRPGGGYHDPSYGERSASQDTRPPTAFAIPYEMQGDPRVSGGGGRGGAGIASLPKMQFKNPWEGAPPMRQTDAQFDAEMARQYERLEKLYGPDVAAQYIKEIKAEREGMSKKYTDNQNEAILRSGLAIMGGKSRHAAINIGEGGIAGLNAYQAGRRDLDSQAAALRREEMQAALQSQQRGDMIRGQAVGRADKRDDQMRQDRADHIEQGKYGQEFGLKMRELDIKMQAVNVEAARNEIIRSGNKADVMARIYQTAQKEAWDVIEKDPRAAGMTPNQKAEMARALAKDWIDNNLGLDIIGARAGVNSPGMPSRMQWPGAR